MASRGRSARAKGHDYERKLAEEWRNLGFEFGQIFWQECKTSRYASKETDDKKVDLVNTEPFNIQAKATERTPPYHELLKEMPKDNNINVVFHKRNNKGEVVVLEKGDFYKLIEKIFAVKE